MESYRPWFDHYFPEKKSIINRFGMKIESPDYKVLGIDSEIYALTVALRKKMVEVPFYERQQ